MADAKIEVRFDKQGRLVVKDDVTREALRRALEGAVGRSFLVVGEAKAVPKRDDTPTPPTNLNCGCFQTDALSNPQLLWEIEVEKEVEEE